MPDVTQNIGRIVSATACGAVLAFLSGYMVRKVSASMDKEAGVPARLPGIRQVSVLVWLPGSLPAEI